MEVLSDSTAAYDRGIKFAAYRKQADLREYLLVDVDQRRLELYRHAAGHGILLESERDGQALRLESVDMTLSPAEAFEDLDEEARSER
ncbi:Uma2 family endonuclease [Thauera phenylacetica]